MVRSAYCHDDLDLPANLLELFGNEERLSQIKEAETVAVCLLHPTSGPPPRSIRDYQESESKTISAGPLAKLLLDESTYDWPKKYLSDGAISITKKGCVPVYHVRAKFQHASRSIEVSFCLGCLDALVVEEGKIVNGSTLSMSGAGKLLGLFLEVFPEDPLLKRGMELYKSR